MIHLSIAPVGHVRIVCHNSAQVTARGVVAFVVGEPLAHVDVVCVVGVFVGAVHA